jgi:hypothetical protein
MKYGQIILGIGVLIATVVGTGSAGERSGGQPAPVMDRATRCEVYGRIADMAANLRDQGVPSSAVMDYLRSITPPVGTPGTTAYGRDMLATNMTTIVLNVYAAPGVSPAKAKLAAYTVCLDTPPAQ